MAVDKIMLLIDKNVEVSVRIVNWGGGVRGNRKQTQTGIQDSAMGHNGFGLVCQEISISTTCELSTLPLYGHVPIK